MAGSGADRFDRDGHADLLLGAYLLGGLEERIDAAVRLHLADCGRCRAACAELQSVTSLLGLLAGPDDEDPLAGPLP